MQPHILMSPPDYFDVLYSINPWMSHGSRVDVELARRQWHALKDAIEQAGAKVSLLPPVEGLPDLVFTANAALVHGRQAIIARYKHAERQGEEPHAERWFRGNGFDVTVLPRGMYFEGAGDALLLEDRFFAGYRSRTDIRAHQAITRVTGLPVLAVELVEPHFYHVDVCICPLEGGYLLYYPGAFDEYGLRVIEANVPEEKRILTTTQEARQFACNAVNVGRTVLFNGSSERLADALRERGFEVVGLDLSEFIKAGGSAKCLTLRLS